MLGLTARVGRCTVHAMDERRLVSRKFVLLPVRLKVSGLVRWVQTQSEDLSAGGFRCLMSGEIWPLGTSVAFEIPLFPAEIPLAGMAQVAHVEQVRHSDQYSIGFKFSDVPPEALHRLHLYLKDVRSERRAPQAKDYGEA